MNTSQNMRFQFLLYAKKRTISIFYNFIYIKAFSRVDVLALNIHLSCLLNFLQKQSLSNLSTQPCQFSGSNFIQKYTFAMFPCTHFDPLARVDNLDVIFETRLNRQLQLCYQCHALHMARPGKHVYWLYLPYTKPTF